MYTGSMVGAGFGAYAVMGYVIASQVPDRKVGFYVELNPRVLATVFGEAEGEIHKAIDYLCAPDPESRTPAEGGRRLIRIGQDAYQVVNGAIYHAIRDEEQRREQNRLAKQRERLKNGLPPKSKPLAGEEAYLAMEKAGKDVSMEPGDKIPLPSGVQ